MNLLLGVTGSISIYKSVEIMRIFQKKGHFVSVIMTESAQKLVSPLLFETFSPGKVYTDLFVRNGEPLVHIDLGKESDLFLIAPATANIIGKISNGIADDLISTTFIAFNKKVIIAPAMNTNMFNSPAVKENLKILSERGVNIIDPGEGSLACSDEGKGRLPDPEKIFYYCMEKFND